MINSPPIHFVHSRREVREVFYLFFSLPDTLMPAIVFSV